MKVIDRPVVDGNAAKRTGENVECPCGEVFYAAAWELRSGRGKYCSQDCKYKYRVRPTGLKYDLKVENTGWIKPGERLSPETEFKSGIQNNPGGGIKLGERMSPETEFQKGQEPHNFMGGYYFRLYGITDEERLDMERAQNNKCAICNLESENRKLCTDHDHVTGKVRGLLCHKCNFALGYFKDSLDNLYSAISYLEKEQ